MTRVEDDAGKNAYGAAEPRLRYTYIDRWPEPGLVAVVQPSEGEGVKHDDGKEPYDLIAPELLDSVSKVLAFGAQKYAARNWEQGMRWGRVFASTMRHLWKWWRGEAKDEETGYSHLWHAGTNIMFLIAYESRGIGQDDRQNVQRRKA